MSELADVEHRHLRSAIEFAVAMAEEVLALDPAPRPEVAALAREIVRVQTEEITVLRGWLEAWGTPAP